MKKALKFTLSLLPVALIAGYFVTVYQLEMLDEAILAPALEQLGSVWILIAISMVQTVGYAAVCGFFGCLLANSLGLWKPIRFEKEQLLKALLYSVLGGIIFSLDKWTFGRWIPEVGASYEAPITVNNWLGSVLYGGVVEELMLRLFFMSLLAWLIWKIFFRQAERVPVKVLIAANVVAALLFAAGHLPATWVLFGELTPMILLRCFLLNGSFGVLFGYLYRKFGIQYAMVSHAMFHIVSKLIWTLI